MTMSFELDVQPFIVVKLEKMRLMINSISSHCKKIVGLDCSYSGIGKKEASAIIELMPKIKYLTIKSSDVRWKLLVMILKGCTDLEMLDVSECYGFEADAEISELVSHIKTFNFNGSKNFPCTESTMFLFKSNQLLRSDESLIHREIDSERERESSSSMEEERKWEDLNRDLLVEIFGRVGLESLSQCIPFVCNSWYKATLVPKCWESLVFPYAYDYEYYEFGHCSVEFVKSAVDRSQGTATHIGFEYYCPYGLVYISEKCSELKSLYLCDSNSCALICDLVCKWKKLEFLHLDDNFSEMNLKQILESISLHCKNFVGLTYSSYDIDEADSAAIVEFIPKIKSLKMSRTDLPRDCLVQILKGCRELEFLDVSDCVGFDAHDTEILELASHIRSFNCDGSVFDDPYDYGVDADDYPLDDYGYSISD